MFHACALTEIVRASWTPQCSSKQQKIAVNKPD